MYMHGRLPPSHAGRGAVITAARRQLHSFADLSGGVVGSFMSGLRSFAQVHQWSPATITSPSHKSTVSCYVLRADIGTICCLEAIQQCSKQCSKGRV